MAESSIKDQDRGQPEGAPELLPWLMPAWERLHQAQRADRLTHALLMVGPRGIGKRWLAQLLARALLCTRPLPTGLGCGQCPDCRLSAAGSHPDLMAVGPDPESKSGEISIEAIRALTERASLTAGRGQRKLVLIDPADFLTAAAANALLKTLEEPSGNALFCLIGEQLGRLPATVRSRCQLLTLAAPPQGQALAWLAARLADGGSDAQEAGRRLALAHGAPLRALHELDRNTLERHRQLRAGLVALASGEADPVGEASAWNGVGARLSLDWLAGWLCDLARLAGAGPGARLDDPQCRLAFGELAQRLDGPGLHRLIRRVLEARGFLDTTINPLLLLESLLIDWARLNGR